MNGEKIDWLYVYLVASTAGLLVIGLAVALSSHAWQCRMIGGFLAGYFARDLVRLLWDK